MLSTSEPFFMAQASKGKRNRSEGESTSEEKRLNMSETPEKANSMDAAVSGNRGTSAKQNGDQNSICKEGERKDNGDKEPSLRDIMSAIDKLHEKI